MAKSTDKKAMVYFFQDAADGNKGKLVIYDVVVPVGISREANNGGTALSIQQSGLCDSVTGLTAGLEHFFNIGGTLGTISNGYPAGTAVSATSLILRAAGPLE
jgi:hypothetical protein